MTFQSLVPNIAVPDVNQTVEYYSQILGFQVVNSIPASGKLAWAMLKVHSITIMFQEEKSFKEEYSSLHNLPIGGCLTLYVFVDNIRALYDNLKSKITLINELNITFYGMTEFAIEDCNGYILTFAQNEKQS
ncbi:MAG: VOC family protein [Candidatus Melainabacteria bacterium]|jgi:uncharacterized glyoxalase superfamily protein PhnB